ncbi:hypothetical protein FSP39_009141 [Pinctada imbricata]|uniref:Uncharacterized protein n=1 Tax=Pinctada imbricata TaxID=66713 RepID=A0AA89CBQ3_PINIB|nr:hypothetical protein FSP39_009141 [Pinctada imbricata]
MKKQTLKKVEVMQSSNIPENELEKVKKLFEGKDISECFALMYIKNEEAMRGVHGEISEIKSRVNELEASAENVQQDIQDIFETSIPAVRDSVAVERKNRLKLDMWGRKWNLIVMGIPGTLRESPRDSEKAFRKMLVENLKFEQEYAQSILLQAVHRLPGGKEEGKRNMIVRLNSLMDRDEILGSARKLPRGTGIGVVPDLPPEISELRSKLLKERRSLPEQVRKDAKIFYTKEYPFVTLKIPTKR